MKKILTLLLTLLVLLSCVPCVMPAYADSDNLALGKPVHSTPTMEPYQQEWVNDGDPKTNWVRAGLVMNAYIGVDLLDTYTITSVVLRNRLDTSEDEADAYIYRTNVEVRFSNDPEFKTYEAVTAMTDVDPGYGVPITVQPPSKTPYRYVRAVKTDTIIFVLAELEVYGYQATDNGSLSEFSDVKGTKYEGPVTLLQNLGAVEGVSEEEYGVYNLMTRGAAANMIVNSFNPGYQTESLQSPFNDVGYGNYYYKGILSAYDLGYVKGRGDGGFGSDDYVSQNEFLSMLLRALGYEQWLANADSYAIGFNSLIKEMKLLRRVSSESTALLNNGDAALIMYNAMLAKRLNIAGMEGDRVLYTASNVSSLEEIYNISLYSGVVNETGRYCLTGDSKNENSTVKIGNTKFLDAGGKLNQYLGRSVTIGVKNDNNNIVSMFWVNEDEQMVTLSARNLQRENTPILGGTLKAFDENGDTKSYRLSRGVDVLHNNAPYIDGNTLSDLYPSMGSITLIDNNGDGVYDVLCVNEYETYYVHGSYTYKDDFTFVDSENVKHTYNLDYLTITMAEGYPGTTTGVKNGRVVRVAKAKGSNECNIVVYSEGKAGRLTQLSDENFVMDETSYYYAYGYQPGADIKVGDYINAFVDNDGEVIWVSENDEQNNNGWLMAFSQKIDCKTDSLNPSLRFKLFTENGEFGIYDVADTLIVDGIKTKEEDFVTALLNASYKTSFENVLLRIKATEEKEITAIDSILTTLAESGITFKEEGTIGTAIYSMSSESFWQGHEMISPAKNYTPVFTIPYVDGSCSTNEAHENLYTVLPLIRVAKDRSGEAQNLTEYMKDEDGYAACYLRTPTYQEVVGESAMVVSQENASFVLVENVAKVSVDGEECTKVSGIDLITNTEVSFTVSANVKLIESGMIYQEQDASQWLAERYRINLGTLLSASESLKAKYIKDIDAIRFGDILRYDLSGDKAIAVERAFAYKPEGTAPVQQKDVWLSVEGSYPETFIAFNRFQLTKAELLSENAITFSVANADAKKELYAREAFDGLYVCDTGRNKLTKGFESDLYGYMDNNYRVMVFCYSTEPSALVVYEYAN